MPRKVAVQFEFNREEDRYEAKCPWCSEVVRSHTLEALMRANAWVPGYVSAGVEHDCVVEP